jgi:hypothetical protein
MSTKYSTKESKRKRDYFSVYNKETQTTEEVKYLSQHELAEGWQQIIPKNGKKNINHFNVTLAYLPENLWSKLRKQNKNGDDVYKVIKDGNTRYTIDESNQDEYMIKLFNEINKINPNKNILKENIELLDENQYTSWLVIRVNSYLKSNIRLNKSSDVIDIINVKINNYE